MAKFYIQTDKGLIQVGNDITLENIKAALGYTPSNFSGDFYDLTNNPFSNGADGEFNIVDENQNIIAIVDKDGIHSVEMTAIKSGITHNLTEKMDASEFESIITVDESGKFVIEDENGNEGLKLDSTGLYVKDVTAGKHVLSQKADLDDIDFNNLVDNPIYIDDTGEFVIEDESGNKGFILNKSGVEAKNFTTSDGVSLNDVDNRVNSIQDKVDSINEMISDDEDDRLIIRDGDGEVGLELNKDGLYVKDVTAGKHVLSQKADLDIVNKKLDKSEFTETISVVEGRVDTNESNITNLSNTVNSHKSQINSIQGEVDSINEMISDAEESSFIVSDNNDYIGLKLDQEGLHVKDVIIGEKEHVLSEKANQSSIIEINKTLDDLNSTVESHTSQIGSISSTVDKKLDKSTFEEVIDTETSNTVKVLYDGKNVGLTVSASGISTSGDVIADGHKLKEKANQSDLEGVDRRLSDIETLLVEDSDDIIDTIKDVIDYFENVSESEVGAAFIESVSENTNNIKTNASDINQLSEDVDKLEESVNDEINGLNNAIEGLSGTVNGRIDDLNGVVNTHTSDIKTINDNISLIEDDVDSINNMISDAEESSFIVSDSNDYIGLKLDQEGLHVKDVIAYIDKDSDNVLHKLSEKANQSDVDAISVITSASASVDSNVGTPSVTVSLIGDDVKNKTLNFEFKNLKGVKGEIGYGIFYTNTEYNSDTTSIIKSDIIDNVRTIQVGDLVLSSNGNIFSVKEIGDNLNVEYLTSIKGTSVTISDVDEKTGSGEISTVTFSNGDSLSIKNGEDGIGIASIEKIDSEGLVDTYTITYTKEDKEPDTFTVTNGKDGASVKDVFCVTGVNSEVYTNPSHGNGNTNYYRIKDENNNWLSGTIEVKDGEDGEDGTSVTITNITQNNIAGQSSTVTFSDGNSLSVKNGLNGVPGTSVTITNITQNNIAGQSSTVTFSDGNSLSIKNGTDGTSVKINGTLEDISYLENLTATNGDGYIIDGFLYVYTGNGEHYGFSNVGEIKGPNGDRGASVASISIVGNLEHGSGKTNTYELTDSDGNKLTGNIEVQDGVDGIGIKDITKKDSSDSDSDLVDTYTITYTDDEKEPYDFYVTNGKDGEKGDDGYSIFYTSHPYSEQTAGIIYTYIDTYGRTIQVGDLILSSNGNIFSVKKVGELLLDVVTVEYLTSIKGIQGASVSSIVCVDGDNSENFADVNNEDGAINYYRIKDNNNNFLEGTIAIKNGSSCSGDDSSDSDGELVDIDIPFEEDESGEFVIIDDSADENIGLILDSEGVAAKDFFTSSDVSLNDVGDRLSVVEDSIGIELITYDNLVQLRNEKLLIPGKKYRITDYVTTTSQASTTSAGHQFDIIVTALTENELSEIASACYHEENYNEDNLEELYIGEFNSITGWDGGGCTFLHSGIRHIDGKVYIEYEDENNNTLIFDFNDKSKVYFDSSDVIKFIPSYYIAPEYGYNDLTENNVSLLEDVFYVPYISTYDNMVDGNETPISISIREEFNRNYFKNLGCNLSAWKIWYSLDNNSDRFAWAKSNGTGVIYRMIDEWGNDCPYDFKNIQFSKTIDDETITSYTFSWRKEYTLDFSTPTTPMFSKGIYIKDTSIAGNNGLLLDDEGNIPGVHNNVIKPYISSGNNKQYLNNICFCSSFDYDGYYHMCINNSFGNDCYNNSFGNDCYNNTLGNVCHNNTFGDMCRINTFGNDCFNNTFGDKFIDNTFGDLFYGNIFGNGCKSSTFGNDCWNNTFGDYCCDITFGNECNFITFGNECNLNKLESGCSNIIFGELCINNTFNVGCEDFEFGNYCWNNTFGNYCFLITFGNGCHGNYFISNSSDITFGNNCGGNILGNGCYNIIFGNYCRNNTFGTSCDNIIFGNSKSTPSSYYKNIIIDNDNRYINLNCTSTTSSSNYYQNVRIGLGVNNTTTIKNINDSNVGQTYETLYKPANSQTITI